MAQYGNPYQKITLAPAPSQTVDRTAEIIARGSAQLGATIERGINKYTEDAQNEANANALKAREAKKALLKQGLIEKPTSSGSVQVNEDGTIDLTKTGTKSIDRADKIIANRETDISTFTPDQRQAYDALNKLKAETPIMNAMTPNEKAQTITAVDGKLQGLMAQRAEKPLTNIEKHQLGRAERVKQRAADKANNITGYQEQQAKLAELDNMLAGGDTDTQKEITNLNRADRLETKSDERYDAEQKLKVEWRLEDRVDRQLQRDIDNAYRDTNLQLAQEKQEAYFKQLVKENGWKDQEAKRQRIIFNQSQRDRRDSNTIANAAITAKPTQFVTHGLEKLSKEEVAKLSDKAAYENMTLAEQQAFSEEYRAADSKVTATKNQIEELQKLIDPSGAVKAQQQKDTDTIEKAFNIGNMQKVLSFIPDKDREKFIANYASSKRFSTKSAYEKVLKNAVIRKIEGTKFEKLADTLEGSNKLNSTKRQYLAQSVQLQKSIPTLQEQVDNIETLYTQRANNRLGNTLGEIATKKVDTQYTTPKEEFVLPGDYNEALFQDMAKENVSNKALVYSSPRYKAKSEAYAKRYTTYKAAEQTLAAATLKYAQDLAKFTLKNKSTKELAQFKAKLNADLAAQENTYKNAQIALKAKLD